MVRTHVVLPKTLVKAIDSRVGKRRRSEFLAKLAEQEMKRQEELHLETVRKKGRGRHARISA